MYNYNKYKLQARTLYETKMKHWINTALSLFWTTFSFGQIVQRQNNESAEQFANRLKPDLSTLTHKVLETNWNSLPVIISLYDQTYKLSIEKDPDQNTYHRIVGAIFIQLESTKYSKTTFGTIDTEGGDPNIETVFFANADADKTKELIVVASWEQRHYDVYGTLYGTFVFDHELTSATLEWKFLKDISSKLDGGCECSWRDGRNGKAKFKTASEIKNELTKLGYKQ